MAWTCQGPSSCIQLMQYWNKQELYTQPLYSFESLGQRPNSTNGCINPSQSCGAYQEFKDLTVYIYFQISVFQLVSCPFFFYPVRILSALKTKELSLKLKFFWVSESILTLNQVLLLPAPFIMIMYYTKLKMARWKLLGWCLNTLNEGLISQKPTATLPLFA